MYVAYFRITVVKLSSMYILKLVFFPPLNIERLNFHSKLKIKFYFVCKKSLIANSDE